jgi:hypothetical protein
MGESNAESALREDKINDDIKHMKIARTYQRKRERRRKRKPPAQATEDSITYPTTTDTLTNNVQEINLTTD